jgi:ketosteroid isomerase-like protein
MGEVLDGEDTDLQNLVRHYHTAADEFARGDPEPVKRIFSHRDDVTLANPFGRAVRGWVQVSEALNFASARFRDGAVTRFESIAEYVAPELATILEVERWQAKVGGRHDLSSFELRVTSTFRREDGTWKLIHRHADPIATPHPDGPLRPTNS